MLSLLRVSRAAFAAPANGLRQPKVASNFFRSSISTAGINRLRQPRIADNFFGSSNLKVGLRRGVHTRSKRSKGVVETKGAVGSIFNKIAKSTGGNTGGNTGGGNTGPQGINMNMKIIYGLMGINGAVYLYWGYCDNAVRQGVKEPIMKMYQTFTLSLVGVFGEHRYSTLMTSVFSHRDVFHLAGNLMSFYFMGRLVAMTPGIGPAAFLTLTLGSGLAGSVGWLFQQFMETKRTRTYNHKHSLGFSGAVMGVGTAAACMYPRTTFLIYGIVPVPLWALMAGYFAYDGYYLNSKKHTGTSHSGHIGGLLFGAAYYVLKLRRLRF